MSTKLINTLKTRGITASEARIVVFVVTVILFVIGAGAPSDGGGLGGF